MESLECIGRFLPSGAILQCSGTLDERTLLLQDLLGMLVISLEEVIATAEEGIDTGTEALVDRFVVLAGSTADLTPLFLHSLDLLDSLVEGRVRGERSRRE